MSEPAFNWLLARARSIGSHNHQLRPVPGTSLPVQQGHGCNHSCGLSNRADAAVSDRAYIHNSCSLMISLIPAWLSVTGILIISIGVPGGQKQRDDRNRPPKDREILVEKKKRPQDWENPKDRRRDKEKPKKRPPA